jgi:hypothetical protein
MCRLKTTDLSLIMNNSQEVSAVVQDLQKIKYVDSVKILKTSKYGLSFVQLSLKSRVINHNFKKNLDERILPKHGLVSEFFNNQVFIIRKSQAK